MLRLKSSVFCPGTLLSIGFAYLSERMSVRRRWCWGQKVKNQKLAIKKISGSFAFPVTIKVIIFDNPLAIFVLPKPGVGCCSAVLICHFLDTTIRLSSI